MQVQASLRAAWFCLGGSVCWALPLCLSVVGTWWREIRIEKDDGGGVHVVSGSCGVMARFFWWLAVMLFGEVQGNVCGAESVIWHVWKRDCDFFPGRGWSWVYMTFL
jgi:hypothetical protein